MSSPSDSLPSPPASVGAVANAELYSRTEADYVEAMTGIAAPVAPGGAE